MPRTARAIVGGLCYHVINRGNARATVFHEPADYRAFLTLMAVASEKIPMRILAYCLMPNHFHMVLWPHGDSDISRWMHWLLTAQTNKHHGKRKTSGRVWQGRFKAFPIQQDRHLLTVMRYVERNALRANLVESACDWPWSSASRQPSEPFHPVKSEGPVTKPDNWLQIVDKPHSQEEIDALRGCVAKNRPYGTDTWARATAEDLGLLSSFRGPGPPNPGHS